MLHNYFNLLLNCCIYTKKSQGHEVQSQDFCLPVWCSPFSLVFFVTLWPVFSRRNELCFYQKCFIACLFCQVRHFLYHASRKSHDLQPIDALQYVADLQMFWSIFPSYTASHSEENPEIISETEISVCILKKYINSYNLSGELQLCDIKRYKKCDIKRYKRYKKCDIKRKGRRDLRSIYFFFFFS